MMGSWGRNPIEVDKHTGTREQVLSASTDLAHLCPSTDPRSSQLSVSATLFSQKTNQGSALHLSHPWTLGDPSKPTWNIMEAIPHPHGQVHLSELPRGGACTLSVPLPPFCDCGDCLALSTGTQVLLEQLRSSSSCLDNLLLHMKPHPAERSVYCQAESRPHGTMWRPETPGAVTEEMLPSMLCLGCACTRQRKGSPGSRWSMSRVEVGMATTRGK
ncbi:uncharacterized protein LOC124989035 [Sciurus carolinensis]|uniref:uncharacterized protein LOC124989035 n=1 Tax=Sciurus carolinensis TaxID=30640 RepID=UPI001FB38585|nr:uncharacterized protein LOC124989035 [Sciurus carolinensis]XP_047414901.1 uncharacterized protein LOC124989035 [Sciurus carolinensis]